MERQQFANRMKEMLEKRKMSLLELAHRTGLGYTHLSRLQKRNPQNISYMAVYQIAEALSMRIRVVFPPIQ